MYRFLDRTTVSLEPRHHFLITAARTWALAVALRRCPCSALAGRFETVGLAATLPHFHQLMGVLNADGLWRLEMGPPCRETIEEDEAVLLGLFDAGSGAEALRRQAEALVAAGSLEPLIAAAARVIADVDGAEALRDRS